MSIEAPYYGSIHDNFELKRQFITDVNAFMKNIVYGVADGAKSIHALKSQVLQGTKIYLKFDLLGMRAAHNFLFVSKI